MPTTQETIFTERQVEVLELREQGYTQKEVAEELGTTDSNVSAIERAAKENVEKSRRTLKLVNTIHSPIQFTAPSGTYFDDLVDEIYAHGDEGGIKIAYCRPELYSHVYGALGDYTDQSRLETSVRIGLTEEGEVKVFTDLP